MFAASFLFFSGSIFAEDLTGITFLSTLKAGDSGPAVLSLQKLLNSDSDTRVAGSGVGSPGQETNYFGSLTKNAVVRFQEKYRNEVLTPVGLSSGTGFVGLMTIKKLNELANVKTTIAPNQISNTNPLTSLPQTPTTPPQNSLAPVVLSVSPDRVRPGDVVTIKGENFTPTNNIVILGDGPVKERFDGLASFNGQTLSFVYQPPSVKTMTKEEILALPSDTLKQIEDPIQKAGVSLDEALTPYKGISSETDLRNALSKNSQFSDDSLYHYFHVLVFNNQGNTMSQTAVLRGLRDFPFDNVANKAEKSLISKLGEKLSGFVGSITPIADAFGMNGGGFTSGIVMVCTCNGNLMTFQIDFSGGGSGLYIFSPGFRPNAGSGLVAGPWLGGYQIMGGSCTIYAGLTCITIMGNTPQKPVGYAF